MTPNSFRLHLADITFQRYKDVGKSYTNVKGVWPMLSRINIIPKSAFGELKDN